MLKLVLKSSLNDGRKHLCRRKYSSANIYIHWPYCTKLCSYCNFNKYINKNVDHERLLSCLLTEWRSLSERHRISSASTIFFGGGTPSLMQLSSVERLVREIAGETRGLEVSLEGNPGDLLGKVTSLESAGVTRLSVGVQAMSDKDLLYLNRDHSVSQAIECLEQSLAVFPNSTSADLIFGRPGQTTAGWLEEVAQLVDMGLPHMSLYQLTVERGTRLAKQVMRGQVSLPEEDVMADMYLGAVELLERRGLARYEVSNFSLPEAECQHNVGYWSGRQYLGLGPGAHSRVGMGEERRAMVNTPLPEHWMLEVERRGHGVRVDRVIGLKESLAELLASGLRRERGIEEEEWDKVCEGMVNLKQFFLTVSEEDRLGLQLSGGRLRLAREKIAVLDHVLPYLMVALDEFKLDCNTG